MGVVTLWSRSPEICYRASLCSKGTVFLGICTVLTVTLPFLLGYKSHGFWLKESTYQEQPDVHFKHRIISVLDTTRPEHPLTWSSYPALNDMMGQTVRTPLISSFEEDTNKDGKNDKLVLDLEFPLLDQEKVLGFRLLMGFDLKLFTMRRVHMSCLAYLSHSSGVPGSQATALGDLTLHQRLPLKHKGMDDRFKHDIVSPETLDPDDFNMATILERYASRNLTTRLENTYTVWSPAGDAESSFLLRVRLQYPPQSIRYTPGVPQVLKAAWIQYLALLVIFGALIAAVKQYVFVNQLIPTWTTVGEGVDKRAL